MPDSWLHSDQGRACLAKCAAGQQTWSGQDDPASDVIGMKAEAGIYESTCEYKEIFPDEDDLSSTSKMTSRHSEDITITKSLDFSESGLANKRRMFTGSLRKINIQERFKWFIERKRYKMHRLKPAISHKSFFLNGLLKGRGEEPYRWNIQLCEDSPMNRPVSMIVTPGPEIDVGDAGHLADLQDTAVQRSADQIYATFRRIRPTKLINEEKESGTLKKKTASVKTQTQGLKDFENLEKVMFLQEVQELRFKSRRKLMEPISEEKDLAFSNAAYNPLDVQNYYENFEAYCTENENAPVYENIENSQAFYENEHFLAGNVASERNHGGDEYERFEFGENAIYQELYFGKTNDAQTMSGKIANYINSVNEVNLLLSCRPEKIYHQDNSEEDSEEIYKEIEFSRFSSNNLEKSNEKISFPIKQESISHTSREKESSVWETAKDQGNKEETIREQKSRAETTKEQESIEDDSREQTNRVKSMSAEALYMEQSRGNQALHIDQSRGNQAVHKDQSRGNQAVHRDQSRRNQSLHIDQSRGNQAVHMDQSRGNQGVHKDQSRSNQSLHIDHYRDNQVLYTYRSKGNQASNTDPSRGKAAEQKKNDPADYTREIKFTEKRNIFGQELRRKASSPKGGERFTAEEQRIVAEFLENCKSDLQCRRKEPAPSNRRASFQRAHKLSAQFKSDVVGESSC